MTRPDFQSLADAYDQPARVLDALPSTTESREAGRLLDLSRDLAYRARERVKPQGEDE